MNKPCGLLLSAGTISPERVAHMLHEQGGPAWDETVFRVLSGVDVRTLVLNEPRSGEGTAMSLASSGWWVRHADDIADRLAEDCGSPVLAVFETDSVSGYHLASPEGGSRRALSRAGRLGWAEGLAEMLGEELDVSSVAPLASIALQVHGDDPKGAHLPGLFAFGLGPNSDLPLLLRSRGEALAAGLQWRPADTRDPSEPVPSIMRSLEMETAVRLPGPPRWARAVRAVAIRVAEEAIRDSGWLCLIPRVADRPAEHGTAVRVLQLAPLPDGSALGVLHPRAAVRVVSDDGATVEVEVVEDLGEVEADQLAEQLDAMLPMLRDCDRLLELDEAALMASDDPAAELGWQLLLTPEQCQRYLASGDRLERLAVLREALEQVEQSPAAGLKG